MLPLGVDGEADARPRGPRRPATPASRPPCRSRPRGPCPSAAPRRGRRAGPASGRLFAPPTYFCTSADLRRRHVELRPPLELQLQVLLDLAVLLQQLQAAVPGDAVGDVDHQVALVQLEEAVDHPAQAAAGARGRAARRPGETARRCSAARCAPAPGGSRFAGCRRGSAAGPRWATRVPPKTSPSRRTSASVWQTRKTSWPAPASSSSLADLLDVAAEPLDRFDRQPAGRFQRAGGHGRGGDRGKRDRPPQHRGHRVEILRPLERSR